MSTRNLYGFRYDITADSEGSFTDENIFISKDRCKEFMVKVANEMTVELNGDESEAYEVQVNEHEEVLIVYSPTGYISHILTLINFVLQDGEV